MNLPLVALESTVITHGLPYPENLRLAKDMENEVRSQGSVPATIAVIDGQVLIGLNDLQLEQLVRGGAVKVSSRDLGAAVAGHMSGGTTVAGTMAVAHQVGIRVFATGGIGGVHRPLPGQTSATFDVSADLMQLAHTPMIVVCAGAKAILDIPATLEVLETYGVPVIGYGTEDFAAFYSRSSGQPTSVSAKSPEEVVYLAHAHWEMGQKSAVLVALPPAEDVALPNQVVEAAIEKAMVELAVLDIHGQEVTPYLLNRVNELTSGKSLQANLAILRANARLAGQIARFVVQTSRTSMA
jgi:pseudouridine-5'-phosphate glycosidase